MNESTAHTFRYVQPGWFTRNVFNRTVAWLTRRGISVMGSRELRLRGRATGATRTTVVNLLDADGVRYLVAPRGTTQWVRNLRAAGNGELRVGRRVEAFEATELSDDAKVPVLRAYLQRWAWEVGQFFDGVTKQASDDELRVIAPGFPVFVVSGASSNPANRNDLPSG